jgi:hypothetical protein
MKQNKNKDKIAPLCTHHTMKAHIANNTFKIDDDSDDDVGTSSKMVVERIGH